MSCESCGVRLAGTLKGLAKRPLLCPSCRAVGRALLERDVAEVQRALDDESEDSWLTTWEAESCEAWLTRARAALS